MRRLAAVWWGVLMTAAVFAVSVLVLVGLESLPKGSSTSKPKAHSERLLQPKEIQGVLCTTRAWYKPDGKLSACVLACGKSAPPAAEAALNFRL